MSPSSASAHLLCVSMVMGLFSAWDSRLAAQMVSRENPTAAPSQGSTPPQTPEPSQAESSRIPIVNSPWWVDRTPTTAPGHFPTIDFDCTACGATSRLDCFTVPVNPNAAWALQGRVRRATRLRVLSAGLLGIRNYASPVYTAMPIGGRFDPGPLTTVTPNLSVPDTQWHLTAGFERTLLTTKRGVTLGLTGDVLLPVSTDPVSGDPRRVDPLSSLAVRFGIVIRW
jgi:hypothetical protein